MRIRPFNRDIAHTSETIVIARDRAGAVARTDAAPGGKPSPRPPPLAVAGPLGEGRWAARGREYGTNGRLRVGLAPGGVIRHAYGSRVHLLGVTPTCHWLEFMDWTEPVIQESLRVKKGRPDP
jgi:hypothetical protein